MSIIVPSKKYSNNLINLPEKKLKHSDSNESFSSLDSRNSNTKEDSNISEKNQTIFSFVKSVSEILIKLSLQEFSLENEQYLKENKHLLKTFELKYIPDITIEDYIIRIINYSECEINTIICALIYIDRLCVKGIKINQKNVFKILFASILISIKNNEDLFYNNQFYSQIAGVKTKELIKLEYNFCVLMEFDFFIDEKEFNKYYTAIQKTIENCN